MGVVLPGRVNPPSGGSVTRGNMAVFDDTTGTLLRETGYAETDVRLKPVYTVVQPTAGQNLTISDNATRDIFYVMEPAGTLATLTVNLPNPQAEQIVWISTTKAITALTLNAQVGDQLNGAVTSLAAGETVAYICEAGDLNDIWWRYS